MDLAKLGLTDAISARFASTWNSTHMLGRVMAVTGPSWLVGTEVGEQLGQVAGRLRHLAEQDRSRLPVVGDWVALRANSGTQAVIDAVLERRNTLTRPDPERPGQTEALVAHVDGVLIVMGLDLDYNLRRLERYLAMARQSGAEPVVVLTKADLSADWPALTKAAIEIAAGSGVHAVSVVSGQGLSQLASTLEALPTVALLGSSGVGKSTLVQALTGAAGILTAPTREADGRGRHTTVGRHLHLRPEGGCLIDTPGLRTVEVSAGTDLGETFFEIGALAKACRFVDCRHQGEPGCAVTAAIAAGALTAERLHAFRKLEREVRHQDAKQDPQLRFAERQRSRKFAKQVRQDLKLRAKRR